MRKYRLEVFSRADEKILIKEFQAPDDLTAFKLMWRCEHYQSIPQNEISHTVIRSEPL